MPTNHPTIISFYKSFYGSEFVRYFRRPPDFRRDKFKIQFTVATPKNLYLHIHRNSGYYPCFIQTYDRGVHDNLKINNPDKMAVDRAYFDFDIDNEQSHQIKKELQDLRRHGLTHEQDKQDKLKEQLRKLIIDVHIAKPAIDEAKKFATEFKESFGREPALFFSGCKGCHAYTFFKPIREVNINRALSLFAEKVKLLFNYETLDESVNKDAISRLSRVPYSKHQYTGLTVVPFTLEDSYEEILEKAINPVAESFTKKDYLSSLGKHLVKIDPILAHNEKKS